MIFDAATKTKGSAGPSGMDAELYRRILCSKNFKAEDKALIERGDSRFHKKSVKDRLPSIFAGSLYLLWTHPLGQKPWNTTCCLDEVLRRIFGKTITGFLKEEVKEAAGPLQVCAGHSAGLEAAIHAMSQVFVEEGTDFIIIIIIIISSFVIPKYNNYDYYHKAYMLKRTTHLSTNAIPQSP